MIDALPLLLGSDEYQISRSVRLRSSASAYFNRTPASAGNRKTWTWSAWVKRGLLSSTDQYNLFTCWSANSDTAFLQLAIYQDKIFVGGWLTNFLISTPVYRDPSAWYHVVITLDTTQTTASNRLRVYINGVEVTAWATDSRSSITQNSDMGINQAAEHNIGRRVPAAYYFDGYLTEINFIDGLTPNTTTRTVGGVTQTVLSELGQFDIVTGVWKPAPWTRSFGTNGFYLNFSDPSAATAAAIGKDYSGNGNNWTPNNITLSPTTSTSYDSMLDVPTPWADGGNGRGNYCTLNRLVASGLSGGGTISNGNLRVSGAAAVSNAYARGTMVLSGKFYAEFSFDVVNATASIGVDTVTATAGALNTSNTNLSYRSGGNRRVLGTETTYGASWVANDIIGVAVDTTANTVEFFKNGVSQGVITSSAFFAQGDCVFAMSKDDVGSPTGFANFGQRPFAYTPPSGFRALNTQNLPVPTILKGNQFFDINLWTGNGTGQTIVNTGAFAPDLVWIKDRTSGTNNPRLLDTIRGATKELYSSLTNAETTDAGSVTAFNANGFTIGNSVGVNASTNSIVGWQWKEGATQGFDIVTYTGDGTSGRDISHSLGVTPSMIITKARNDTTYSWHAWHTGIGADYYISLNTPAARDNSVNIFPFAGITSTAFRTATSAIRYNNLSAVTYVAYLFSEVAGFSRFGSYTGNGNADGPFVFCGFRPRWVMIKSSTIGGTNYDWWILDTARSTSNVVRAVLFSNAASVESTDNWIDINANGFKLRNTYGASNASGQTYIFAAFAENPFKYSLAR